MVQRRLLIADADSSFRQALTQALKDSYVIYACSTGTEALTVWDRIDPDVVVIDLMLPYLDGLSLIQRQASQKPLPPTLVTSRLYNDYILECLQQLGVRYAILKPCQIQHLAQRVLELEKYVLADPVSPRAYATRLLLALGVPANLHGFTYLQEAIPMLATDPGQAMTKQLYPAVAHIFGTSAALVERAIRNAVTHAWEQRSDPVWSLYFPPGPDGSVPHPTNSAFLSCLADALRIQLP